MYSYVLDAAITIVGSNIYFLCDGGCDVAPFGSSNTSIATIGSACTFHVMVSCYVASSNLSDLAIVAALVLDLKR